MHEGGISTPLIVHSPQLVTTPGELRHQPGHVIDIWPTLTGWAGVNNSVPIANAPARSGLAINLAPDAPAVKRNLWWSHEGHRAIRVGDMKLVSARGNPWELFDLPHDRAEQHDLSNSDPGKARELEAIWEQQWSDFQKQALQPD